MKPFNEIKEMRLGLEAITELLDQFGNPHLAFKTIHVAGTNGKGSVSTKIAKSYEYAGYKVGLYTSPHIFSLNERIQINGNAIPDDEVEVMNAWEFDITFFEKMTLLAFLYFQKEQVDIAIIEVGLGGRLDATNVIQPILSVITSISKDHTAILGETIEEIAKEKGGIIKENVPLVLGPKANLKILHEIAAAKNAPYKAVKDANFSSYDLENQMIAKIALEYLGIEPLGLEEKPLFRLQEVQEGIFFDVGHNPDGIKRTLESVAHLYPSKKIHLIFGMSQDKDVQACLNIVSQYVDEAHFVRTEFERLMEPKELQRLYTGKSMAYSSVEEAVQYVLKIRKSDELVLVMGSFFIMQAVFEAIKR